MTDPDYALDLAFVSRVYRIALLRRALEHQDKPGGLAYELSEAAHAAGELAAQYAACAFSRGKAEA